MLKDMIPMIYCDDVRASTKWYCDVLGFEVKSQMDDVGKTGWASLGMGEVALMLMSPTSHPEPVKVDGKHPAAIYYFYPEDVVGLHGSLRDKGEQVSDLRETFYEMTEFSLEDPSGHMLVFGQAV
jgi:uncharacterized glyoxalase superfamily protein PhnB